MPKVSIIVPVYNVEKYLDQCMESLVNQTYTDIEIVLVNDGSTDGSPEKCVEWAAKDSRITYFSQENQGAGPARNLGIRMAKAEFVAFCDPDDWYNLEYIEMMVTKQEEEEADIVVCGYYTYDEEKSSIVSEYYCDAIGICSFFLGANPALWNKLFRKTLFINFNIKMPSCYGQDSAIHPYITIKAQTLSVVNELLYYYRSTRPNSAMQMPERHVQSTVDFLIHLYNLFIQGCDFEKYQKWLYRYSASHIFFWSDKIKDSEELYEQWKEDCIAILNRYFPDMKKLYNLCVCGLGSYSLYNALARKLFLRSECINEYCFTSLISLMSQKPVEFSIETGSQFRDKALKRDFQKSFPRDIGASDNEYVIIDFLDERFDIIELDGGYYTASDAFFGNKAPMPKYRIIDRCSDEIKQLWTENCKRFIDLIKSCYAPDKIILVKNYLSEHYGLRGKEALFDDVEKIIAINSILESYYDFFIASCPGIHVIEPKVEAIYTFKHFRHGCRPWHYNNEYYLSIGDELLDYILEDREYAAKGQYGNTLL